MFPLAFERYETKYPINLRWNNDIPFIYIENNKSNIALLYCHGNGEDLGMITEHLQNLSKTIVVNILACEYPGYGLYKNMFPSESRVDDTVKTMYEYMVNSMHIPNDRIVIVGRSIGTGPGAYISTMKPCKALVLISPFTSICAMAKEVLGKDISMLYKNRFPTDKNIVNTKAESVLFIHGEEDHVIPCNHSRILYNLCPVDKKISIVGECGHNNIDIPQGIIIPINDLLNRLYGSNRKYTQSNTTYFCPAPVIPNVNVESETHTDNMNSFTSKGMMVACSVVESGCAISSYLFSIFDNMNCASIHAGKNKQD